MPALSPCFARRRLLVRDCVLNYETDFRKRGGANLVDDSGNPFGLVEKNRGAVRRDAASFVT